MGGQPTLRTYDEAVDWLRDVADEFADVPLRLHSTGTTGRHTSPGSPVLHSAVTGGQDDYLGSPPFSPAFLRHMTTGPSAVKEITTRESCPRPHPLDAMCELCQNTYSFDVTRLRYLRPLASALERLGHVPPTSPAWPKQRDMILALVASGFRLDGAARVIRHPIGSDDERTTIEAAFVLAIRRLHDRYSAGPQQKWTALSSSQQAAIIEGESAA